MDHAVPTEAAGLPSAATAILVRQGTTGLEVYLVRRNPRSGFMGGNYVFPGGVVDAEDREPDRWAGLTDLSPQALEERLGGDLPTGQTLAYAIAAIRETFEEAGVFLGDADGDEGLRAVLERRRERALPKGWLSREAEDRGWRLGLSRLLRWARWVTPRGMPRRYDTLFFLAGSPGGQRCVPDGREIVDGRWLTPAEALARNLTGEVPLSPPTLVTVQDLLPHGDAAALLARERSWGPTLAPRLVRVGRGAGVILQPWDPDWAAPEVQHLEPEALEKGTLAAGEPFSRLWHDGRIWRPVRAR